MTQRFIKGYTNNHLSWVMVDATDFATPESALSAATKIKIYGKTKGATGVNFVSSGTGSLTNDIQHVGPSVTGVYTIALAKADLSDASAAWYDQYVVTLSATGAAYQTLVIDGGIMESYLSAAMSDTLSAAVALSDAVSNTYSAIIITQSMASDAASAAQQANSRVILIQSRLSDFQSAYGSDISDIYSLLSDTRSTMDSQFLVVSNYLSSISAIASDAHSQALLGSSRASDAHSAAVDASSRILLVQSRLSDFNSAYNSDISDVRSMLTALSDAISNVDSAADSQYSDLLSTMGSQYSDLKSAVGAVSVALSASDISDLASQVVAAISSAILDVNVVQVNEVAVSGIGTAVNPWGPG